MTDTVVAAVEVASPLSVASRQAKSYRSVAGRWFSRCTMLILLALLLGLWVFLVEVVKVSPLILPGPKQVVQYVFDNSSRFLTAGVESVTTIVLGLIVGLVLGALFAVLAWWSPLAAGLARPGAELVGAVPLAVLIPVVTRLLGYGDLSTVALTGVLCFFPAYAMLSASLSDYPAGSFDYFAVSGANKFQTLIRLSLMAALPGFMLALQLCAIIAVLATVATEFLTGSGGMGLLMAQSAAAGGMSGKWAAAIITTAFAYFAYLATHFLHRWVTARLR